MKNKYPIGILGATGMVGQRYIQLLADHPWFEIAWLAASDRSSGKSYGEAAKWRLDTPLPERIAKMIVSVAEPEGAPKIIFASVDTAIAREMEPKFAAAGCAVISNSSAFRMAPNVPLVLPEVNGGHLKLIEEQPWRKESGGYIVTNSNCSAMGLVLALKPIEERFGIEQIFVTTMQAVSGAGYPGVASMDILDNVIPFIATEEEKMETETLKLLGKLEGNAVTPLNAKMTAHCNRVAGGGWAYRVRVDKVGQEIGTRSKARRHSRRVAGFPAASRAGLADRAGTADRVDGTERQTATAPGPQQRQGHDGDRGKAAPVQRAGLEVCAALAQHRARRGWSDDFECRDAGKPGEVGAGCGSGGARLESLPAERAGKQMEA